MSIPLKETDQDFRDKQYISTKHGVTVFLYLSYSLLYQVKLTFLCICLNFVTIFFLFEKRGSVRHFITLKVCITLFGYTYFHCIRASVLNLSL